MKAPFFSALLLFIGILISIQTAVADSGYRGTIYIDLPAGTQVGDNPGDFKLGHNELPHVNFHAESKTRYIYNTGGNVVNFYGHFIRNSTQKNYCGCKINAETWHDNTDNMWTTLQVYGPLCDLNNSDVRNPRPSSGTDNIPQPAIVKLKASC